MTLLVFEHELRVTTPRETAALYTELGSKWVSVKGWAAREAAEIDQLIAAMAPHDSDSVNFDSGTLDDDACVALAALLETSPGYVDVRDERRTNLRV